MIYEMNNEKNKYELKMLYLDSEITYVFVQNA